MNNDSKARFSDPDLWIRLLYMILFALLTWLSRLVLCVIGLLQFLLVLFSGAENRTLRDFSASLAEWTLRAFRFICFNSEQKPFPFDEWPEEPEVEVIAATAIAIPAAEASVSTEAESPVADAEGATEVVVDDTAVGADSSETEAVASDGVEDLPADAPANPAQDLDPDSQPKP